MGVRQGQVSYVKEIASPKLVLFSTIIQFWKEVEGEFGKTKATEGFFGIAMTEKKPDLKPGEMVNVEIVSYQSGVNPNDPTGRENIQARCLLLSRVKSTTSEEERAKVAKEQTA